MLLFFYMFNFMFINLGLFFNIIYSNVYYKVLVII